MNPEAMESSVREFFSRVRGGLYTVIPGSIKFGLYHIKRDPDHVSGAHDQVPASDMEKIIELLQGGNGLSVRRKPNGYEILYCKDLLPIAVFDDRQVPNSYQDVMEHLVSCHLRQLP